jgi:hypothetical protein
VAPVVAAPAPPAPTAAGVAPAIQADDLKDEVDHLLHALSILNRAALAAAELTAERDELKQRVNDHRRKSRLVNMLQWGLKK